MLSNEKSTFDITAEMTRQYKAMQENLMGKIGVLEGEIHKLKDELGEADRRTTARVCGMRPHTRAKSRSRLARSIATRSGCEGAAGRHDEGEGRGHCPQRRGD